MVRKVDWSAISALLSHLQLSWALSGWALSGFLIIGLALRWQMFVRQQEITIPFLTIFYLTWAGQFFNSVLPGSTGGDVVKIYQLCRLAPDRKAAAAATVLVDRLTALIALLAIAGGAFLIYPAPLSFLAVPALPATTILGYGAGLLLLAAVGFWLLYRLLRSSRWGGRVFRTLEAAKTGLSLNRIFLTAILLSFAIHLINISVAYLFARALGISLTYLQILLMMPVVLFLVLLPITINGHGLRELLLIGYCSVLGVTVVGPYSGVPEIVVAFSILLVTNDLLWSIPGGIWYMTRDRSANRSAKDQAKPNCAD